MRVRKRTDLFFYETRRLKSAETLGSSSRMMKLKCTRGIIPVVSLVSENLYYYFYMSDVATPAELFCARAILFFFIWHPDLVHYLTYVYKKKSVAYDIHVSTSPIRFNSTVRPKMCQFLADPVTNFFCGSDGCADV